MGKINRRMEDEILNELKAYGKQNEILSRLFAKMKEEIDTLIVMLMDFYESLPEEKNDE